MAMEYARIMDDASQWVSPEVVDGIMRDVMAVVMEGNPGGGEPTKAAGALVEIARAGRAEERAIRLLDDSLQVFEGRAHGDDFRRFSDVNRRDLVDRAKEALRDPSRRTRIVFGEQ